LLLKELAGSRRRRPRRIVEVSGGEVSGSDAHGQDPLRGLACQRRGVEQECGNRAAQHSSARFPRDSQVLSSAAFGGWLYISTARSRPRAPPARTTQTSSSLKKKRATKAAAVTLTANQLGACPQPAGRRT